MKKRRQHPIAYMYGWNVGERKWVCMACNYSSKNKKGVFAHINRRHKKKVVEVTLILARGQDPIVTSEGITYI